jgi:predicted  nucleic acid-binding Zn-ribbon protein
MSRLFRAQDQSWKLVYEHLLSIPDSVEAKRLLNRAFFAEIQDWAEAGVDNLFSIRKDLYAKIDQLEAKIERLERRIERGSEDLNQRGPTSTDINYSNVIDLAKARAKRLIMALKHRRQGLIDEKENEKSIIDFIESDIQEFEEKLRNTRRAYFLRAV